jgi:hypothetical protein
MNSKFSIKNTNKELLFQQEYMFSLEKELKTVKTELKTVKTELSNTRQTLSDYTSVRIKDGMNASHLIVITGYDSRVILPLDCESRIEQLENFLSEFPIGHINFKGCTDMKGVGMLTEGVLFDITGGMSTALRIVNDLFFSDWYCCVYGIRSIEYNQETDMLVIVLEAESG